MIRYQTDRTKKRLRAVPVSPFPLPPVQTLPKQRADKPLQGASKRAISKPAPASTVAGDAVPDQVRRFVKVKGSSRAVVLHKNDGESSRAVHMQRFKRVEGKAKKWKKDGGDKEGEVRRQGVKQGVGVMEEGEGSNKDSVWKVESKSGSKDTVVVGMLDVGASPNKPIEIDSDEESERSEGDEYGHDDDKEGKENTRSGHPPSDALRETLPEPENLSNSAHGYSPNHLCSDGMHQVVRPSNTESPTDKPLDQTQVCLHHAVLSRSTAPFRQMETESENTFQAPSKTEPVASPPPNPSLLLPSSPPSAKPNATLKQPLATEPVEAKSKEKGDQHGPILQKALTVQINTPAENIPAEIKVTAGSVRDVARFFYDASIELDKAADEMQIASEDGTLQAVATNRDIRSSANRSDGNEGGEKTRRLDDCTGSVNTANTGNSKKHDILMLKLRELEAKSRAKKAEAKAAKLKRKIISMEDESVQGQKKVRGKDGGGKRKKSFDQEEPRKRVAGQE